MNALMFVFMLTAAGTPTVLSLNFPSLALCVAAIPQAKELALKQRDQGGSPVQYYSVSCVKPVKVTPS